MVGTDDNYRTGMKEKPAVVSPKGDYVSGIVDRLFLGLC
jgi:hypothetical protein